MYDSNYKVLNYTVTTTIVHYSRTKDNFALLQLTEVHVELQRSYDSVVLAWDILKSLNTKSESEDASYIIVSLWYD